MLRLFTGTLLIVAMLRSFTMGEELTSDVVECAATAQATSAPDLGELLDKFVTSTKWREQAALQKELAGFGPKVASEVYRQFRQNDDEAVRLRCLKLLTTDFPDSEETREAVSRALRDNSGAVRYHAAWHAGDLKLYATHKRLRRLTSDESAGVRSAASKSLAELGEPDAIVALVRDMESPSYMTRYMANIGAKALTGKNLNDFAGYNYGEGAFVSGGVEATILNPHPADVHEKQATRHQAIAEFCLWLERERPEIFKHLYAP